MKRIRWFKMAEGLLGRILLTAVIGFFLLIIVIMAYS